MGWHLFQVTYDLLSPLHIGYHKVGNAQRTRYYVPARNLWAAVTERLTRSGFHTDDVPEGCYEKIGEWVKQHVAFSYFFVRDGDGLLYPRYTGSGLCYGGLSAEEFERRFLSAHVTTALDAATTSAAAGSLHEVEFIAPHERQEGKRVSVGGWVWLDKRSRELLDEGGWRARLGELQMGGERRYGFGRLRLRAWTAQAVLPCGYACVADGDRPILTVRPNWPLLAHAALEGVRAKGMIEPLVGRETRGDSASFGQELTAARACWTPGSVVEQEGAFALEASGVWRSSKPA